MATILVLDDEPSNLEVIAAMLACRGHTVLAVSAGEDALRISQTHEGEIDLVVIDIFLRGLSGTAIAHEIARFRPDVPFLYISGTSKERLNGLLTAAGNSGARTRFLAKPFSTDQLIAEVDSLLAPAEGRADGQR